MDWNEATKELEKKLDPDNVKPPKKQGPKGDYIEGWHAIAEANRIFGFGGWSYTITGLTKDSVENVEKQGSNGPYKQWQAAYTCIVRVTVGDVVREDVGFGSGYAGNIGDAIEGATKEAVTDALKRCLRTFGNPFGLALYDKDRASVGKERDPQAIAEGLISNVKKAVSEEKLTVVLNNPTFKDALHWLEGEHKLQAANVQAEIETKKQELAA